MSMGYAMENPKLETRLLGHDLAVGELTMSSYVSLHVGLYLAGQLSMDQKRQMVSV